MVVVHGYMLYTCSLSLRSGPVLVQAMALGSYSFQGRPQPLIWYIVGLLLSKVHSLSVVPCLLLDSKAAILTVEADLATLVILLLQCQWISTRRAGMIFYHVCGLLGRLPHCTSLIAIAISDASRHSFFLLLASTGNHSPLIYDKILLMVSWRFLPSTCRLPRIDGQSPLYMI